MGSTVHDAFIRSFLGLGTMSTATQFPPVNVLKRETNSGTEYKVELAVAGFSKNDLDVTTDNGQLIVSGEKKSTTTSNWEVVDQGIATRKFSKVFILPADTVVTEADVDQGILTVYLETKKSRNRVTIK